MSFVRIHKLSAFYHGQDPVLENVSFHISRPGLFLFFGENGCGKSTLLACIGGINQTMGLRCTGDVGVSSRPLTLMQEPENEVFAETVFADFGMSCWLNGFTFRDKEHYLADFGVDHLKLRPPLEISSGELKRAVLASLFASGPPDILLLDEPLIRLDPQFRPSFIQTIRQVSQEIIVIVASHRLHDFFPIVDGVFLFKGGLVQCLDLRNQSEIERLLSEHGVTRFSGELYKENKISSFIIGFEESRLLDVDIKVGERRKKIRKFGYQKACITANRLSWNVSPDLKLEIDGDYELGSITAIFGDNGSGKTTLGMAMCGLLYPQRGAICIRNNGRELEGIFVPDNPYLLLAEETVEQEVTRWGVPFSRVESDLQRIGVLGNARIEELSYGQAKWLSFIVGIYSETDFVVLDEPAHSLSWGFVERMRELLLSSNKIQIVLTHDVEVFGLLADQKYILQDGSLRRTPLLDKYPAWFETILRKSELRWWDTEEISVSV